VRFCAVFLTQNHTPHHTLWCGEVWLVYFANDFGRFRCSSSIFV